MTIRIENASKKLHKAIKAMAELDNATCEIEAEKQKVKKPKLTKFEKEILKAKAELEKERENGTLKTYKSAKEFREAVENGEI